MTKEDFYILRNSITMRQVADHYNFKITKRGGSFFILCPFHNDVNASLQIYDGFRGFYCRGCGTGGDVTRFVELYEGVSRKGAAKMLSSWFGIPISENGEIPLETRIRANKARLKHEQELLKQSELQADLRQICANLIALTQMAKRLEPFSDAWCYVQNEIPKIIGEWEERFAEVRMV